MFKRERVKLQTYLVFLLWTIWIWNAGGKRFLVAADRAILSQEITTDLRFWRAWRIYCEIKQGKLNLIWLLMQEPFNNAAEMSWHSGLP